MRRHSTAFAAGVVALSFTVPASLTATPSAVIAGQPVRFDGGIPVDGCPRADAATLVATAAFFPPDGFGPSTTRDAAGSFTVTYTVPSSTPPGAYDIGVRCGGGLAPPSTRVTVGAPSPST
ncbi:MAG TPA: hypothetical protein VHN98_10820, partial [Acidimicrobiales bacterium]|nr:hypothetical protein [Acidimicrobiales bacterium]